jgi:hypothetical protein
MPAETPARGMVQNGGILRGVFFEPYVNLTTHKARFCWGFRIWECNVSIQAGKKNKNRKDGGALRAVVRSGRQSEGATLARGFSLAQPPRTASGSPRAKVLRQLTSAGGQGKLLGARARGRFEGLFFEP